MCACLFTYSYVLIYKTFIWKFYRPNLKSYYENGKNSLTIYPGVVKRLLKCWRGRGTNKKRRALSEEKKRAPTKNNLKAKISFCFCLNIGIYPYDDFYICFFFIHHKRYFFY